MILYIKENKIDGRWAAKKLFKWTPLIKRFLNINKSESY
jgi:hypothetical protein